MTKKLTGASGMHYLGVLAWAPPDFSTHTRAPLTTDYQQFDIGHHWHQDKTENVWVLTDRQAHVATWTLITGGGTSTITQIDGGTNITTVDPTGPTVTVNLDDSVTLAGTLTMPALGLGVVQSDAAGLLFANSGTDGQVIVGNSSGAADWYTLKSADGSVLFSTGAGTLDLRAVGGGGTGLTSMPTDSGTATVSGTGTIDVLGGTNLNTVASGASAITVNLDNDITLSGSLSTGTTLSSGTTATVGTDLTVSGLTRGVVQSSAAGLLSSSEGTDGQLLISSSTGAPAWATLTPGANVTITPGSNSITIAASASGGGLVTNTTDVGTATISGINNIAILGGSNLNTAGSGSTVTVNMDNTISVSGSLSAGTTVTAGTGITSTTGNIVASAGNISSTLGSVSAGTTLSSGTTTTVGTDLTVSGLGAGVVQSSTAGLLSSSNGTDGQVLIGGGTAPAWASLTPGTGITFTPGPNSLEIIASGAGVASVTGGTGISISGTATDPIINATGGGGVTGVYGGTNITSNNPTGPSTTVSLNNPIAWNLAGRITMQSGNFLNAGPSGTSVFLGMSSGPTTDNVQNSTGVGHAALIRAKNTSNYNTAVGYYAMGGGDVAGTANAAFGHNAGYSLTSGFGNVLLGGGSGYSLTTGSGNLMAHAGNNTVTTGFNNIVLRDGRNLTLSDSYNIIIGNPAVAGDNNTIRIGTQGSGASQQDTTYIAGIYGANVGGNGSSVYINSNGQLGTLGGGLPPVAFRAYQSVNRANVTGDGSTYWLGAQAVMEVEYNAGGNFTPGSGGGTPAKFTAPITGLYNFTLSILLTNITVPPPPPSPPPTPVYEDPLSIVCTGKTYQLINPALVYSGEQTLFYTVYARMTAGNTAQFNCAIITDYLTKTVGVGATHTWVGGFLVHA